MSVQSKPQMMEITSQSATKDLVRHSRSTALPRKRIVMLEKINVHGHRPVKGYVRNCHRGPRKTRWGFNANHSAVKDAKKTEQMKPRVDRTRIVVTAGVNN
jgi:hypothetical protein